jgi:single-strand DNA-binding protein
MGLPPLGDEVETHGSVTSLGDARSSSATSILKGGTMSISVNKVILLGYAGRDPEIRTTSNGTPVAQLSVATHYLIGAGSGTERGEERTAWHRITAWGRLATLAERRLRKGMRLYVEGYLEYGSYERDGVTVPTVEVHARELIVLTPPSAAAPIPSEDEDPVMVIPDEAGATTT